MAIIDGFLPEYSQEMAMTRKVLAIVPEQHFGWKPHEKSMSLQQLASHIAETSQWIDTTMNQDVFEMDPTQYVPYNAENVADLLKTFDENVAHAQEIMQGRDDAHMMAPWKMVVAGNTVFEMPRIAVLKMFMVNHVIHHRGQLTVYLRMHDVPLPQVYGPTADDTAGMGA